MIFEYVGWAFLALLFVYILARLVTAAFFQSKRDHERMGHNGTSKPARE